MLFIIIVPSFIKTFSQIVAFLDIILGKVKPSFLQFVKILFLIFGLFMKPIAFSKLLHLYFFQF